MLQPELKHVPLLLQGRLLAILAHKGCGDLLRSVSASSLGLFQRAFEFGP